MNNFNLSPDKLNMLLSMASKKAGTSPEQMKAQIEKGNITEVVRQMGGSNANQINQLLNNPQEMEKLMNSPQLKDLMNKLMGSGNR